MTTLPSWRKSSRSANTTNCVELHRTLAAVRDSKRPAGPELSVTGLSEFIQQIKTGRFDR
ncbi:DUF397 domain-containing protein [Actinophytocola sp.]|uniref:DUF397 domain-containing protein n=1 Tax=Actinophytocola sp. TaxID=1872138 RepID=UPI002ED23A55